MTTPMDLKFASPMGAEQMLEKIRQVQKMELIEIQSVDAIDVQNCGCDWVGHRHA
jgi:uncharacterized membrane protein